MFRTIRNLAFILIAAVVLVFLAGAVGERLGNWTDGQPSHIATLVWIASDAVLIVLGISAIWFWRGRRRERSSPPRNPGNSP